MSYVPAMITVLAVAQNEDGKFLLIREADEKYKGKWYLPAGPVYPTETIIEGLSREVKEEAGVEIEPKGILRIYHEVFKDPQPYHRWIMIFEVKVIAGKLKTEPDDRSLEAKWFTLEEVRKKEKELRDDLVLGILQLYQESKKNGSIVPISCFHSSSFK